MHLNNKGLFYEVILVFFAVIILSASFFNIITSENTQAKVGKTSLNLMNLDRETKLDLDILEKAAEFNIFNSITALLQNQGFSKEQLKNCKTWSDKGECSLSKAKLTNNLKIYLDENLNPIFKKYNGKIKIETDIKDDKIIVTLTLNNLIFTKDNVEFNLNHKFSKEVTFNLNNIQQLYDKYSTQLIENCPDKDKSNTETITLEAGLTCKEDKESLNFEYQTQKFYFNNDQNSLEYPKSLQPVLKFKVLKVQQVQPIL